MKLPFLQLRWNNGESIGVPMEPGKFCVDYRHNHLATNAGLFVAEDH